MSNVTAIVPRIFSDDVMKRNLLLCIEFKYNCEQKTRKKNTSGKKKQENQLSRSKHKEYSHTSVMW